MLMNSKNSKISHSHRLLLNLSDKIDLEKEMINILFYQNLAFTIHGKIQKRYTKIINLKYQLQRRMRTYMTDCILYKIFKVILSIF